LPYYAEPLLPPHAMLIFHISMIFLRLCLSFIGFHYITFTAAFDFHYFITPLADISATELILILFASRHYASPFSLD
jgi:hypothetical protein